MTIRTLAFASTLAILGSLIGISSIAPSAKAAPQAESATQIKEESSETLRQGLPGRRLGGGTRSDRVFAHDYVYLAALVTADNLSTTTAAHPSLMFYVPEMVEDQTVEFVLRDRNDQLVYETAFQVEKTGGLISIDTATTGIDPLNLNENYEWYFSIIPNHEDRANDIVVYGSVQRVDETGATLWHDAITTTGALYQENPQDINITAAWNQLIETAGLTAIIESPAPIIQAGLQPLDVDL